MKSPIHSPKRDPNVDWHRWFAWHPVYVRFERRWLTYVERNIRAKRPAKLNGDIGQQRRRRRLEENGPSSPR